jgi:hypothetical protein
MTAAAAIPVTAMIQFVRSIMITEPSKKRHGRNHGGKALVHGLAEGIHIVGYPAQNISRFMRIEILQRHPVDFSGNIRTHIAP